MNVMNFMFMDEEMGEYKEKRKKKLFFLWFISRLYISLYKYISRLICVSHYNSEKRG